MTNNYVLVNKNLIDDEANHTSNIGSAYWDSLSADRLTYAYLAKR